MRNLISSVVVLVSVAACGNKEPAKNDKPRDMVAERVAITGFKDRACACKDATCANKVAEDLKAWMMTDRGVAPDQPDEERKKDLEVMTQFITCLDTAREAK